MVRFIWQRKSWPQWTFDGNILLKPLTDLRKRQGDLLARFESLNKDDALRVYAGFLEADAVATAAIEGVKLDDKWVRSHIAWQLGLPQENLLHVPDPVKGVVDLLIDATHKRQELTDERLFGWHNALFPNGHNGRYSIEVARWRTTPMRVISGSSGKEVVHFEAPAPESVPREMRTFLSWFNGESLALDGVIRAALAHLYFLTIHPFEDGNGRLARAITDLALAQDNESVFRVGSMSQLILKHRKDYYGILEKTQRGKGDATGWILWFVNVLTEAVDEALKALQPWLARENFRRRLADVDINMRQRQVLNWMLVNFDDDGQEMRLTTRRYVELTGASRATAWREIEELLSAGLIKAMSAKGRSTAYELVLGENSN